MFTFQLETEKNLAVNQADWLNKELTRVHSEYNSARIAFQNELNEKSNDMRLESLQKQYFVSAFLFYTF